MRTLSEDLAERMREGGDGRSDIWRAFADRDLFARVVAALAAPYRGERYTKVAGVEARGFVLGGAMAAHTGAGFVAIRKEEGWLPGDLAEAVTGPDWQGHTHALRMQRDALGPDDRREHRSDARGHVDRRRRPLRRGPRRARAPARAATR
jgi:adenine phosphoribosyltransferase